MTPLYRLGTAAYHAGVRLAGLVGHERAAAWAKGRSAQTTPPKPPGKKRLWMHCASLGEWEQGRPVLDTLRRELPNWEVVISFYSPSGYERSQDVPGVDYALYLPEDTPGKAATWVKTLAPDLAIFVKYEFWFYHLRALRRAGVPTWLIAANFRSSQPFFRFYGGWHRRLLGLFTGIICQTYDSFQLLTQMGEYPEDQSFVGGDPRMDRTLALAQAPFDDPVVAAFAEGRTTIIAGSVWPEDMRVWRAVADDVRAGWAIVFAPHQLHEADLARARVQWGGARYTQTTPEEARREDVLILDTIGILSRAYRYGDVAYVGGAFKTGLHNTLEPMAYGLPTIFGPRYQKFPEATEALNGGGAFTVTTPRELEAVLNQLRDPQNYDRARKAQRDLARENSGSAVRTARIVLNTLTR